VLDTTIDMGTPQLLYDRTSAIVDDMGGWPESDLVFVIDSHIVSEDTDIDLTVYTFPELQALVDLIQAIDLDTDVAADTTAGDVW